MNTTLWKRTNQAGMQIHYGWLVADWPHEVRPAKEDSIKSWVKIYVERKKKSEKS